MTGLTLPSLSTRTWVNRVRLRRRWGDDCSGRDAAVEAAVGESVSGDPGVGDAGFERGFTVFALSDVTGSQLPESQSGEAGRGAVQQERESEHKVERLRLAIGADFDPGELCADLFGELAVPLGEDDESHEGEGEEGGEGGRVCRTMGLPHDRVRAAS
ncbi:hypothetical protein [Streptomyces hydrogenans]|uniref:hypothetical protein n=1 Tax=Streptomyces hydrogenans TaxID=1873719 RepID=UPI00382DDCA8